MRCDSTIFSAGACCAIAASFSRSMPAQNVLPAPVMIATRAWLFSMASSVDCNSEIIFELMALRLSGRFKVSVANSPVNSNVSVSYMAARLLTSGSFGEILAHFSVGGCHRALLQRQCSSYQEASSVPKDGKRCLTLDMH